MNWMTARHVALIGAFAVIAAAAAGSGCSAVPRFSNLLAEDKGPAPPEAIPPDQATVKMQVMRKANEVQRVRIPLQNGALVEDVLVKAGLTRQLSDMQVTIVRNLPDGKNIKLDIHYNHAKRQVDPSYNYALLPDDLIVVNEVSRSMLDDLLDRVGDPLVGRYRRS